MSRIAPPAEKITATANIYRALVAELGWEGSATALLNAAVAIAMATDTRDMGILGAPPVMPLDPAPGTSLWRFMNHPDTMQEEDWERLALAYVNTLRGEPRPEPRGIPEGNAR